MIFKLVFILISITYATGERTKSNNQYNEDDHVEVCSYFNKYLKISVF